MTIPQNKQLLAYMKDVFNDDEVKIFSFSYFPDVMDHYSESMSEIDKLIILISFCQRHNRMEALLQALKEERPDSHEELLAILSVPETNSLPQTAVPTIAQSQPIQAAPITGETFLHEKTGLEFVHVPAGEFIFGEANKQTTINLPDFWISKTPVTNTVYKRFIDANPDFRIPKTLIGMDHNWDKRSRAYPAGRENHPITLVSADDAAAFCEWAGLALPTREQWEKAGRGIDGRIFPWGNAVATKDVCNFGSHEKNTTPVGKYSPQGDSPYGCVDMSGNVYEWCSEKEGNTFEIRGGAWNTGEEFARLPHPYPYDKTTRYFDLGFRVVLNSSPWE